MTRALRALALFAGVFATASSASVCAEIPQLGHADFPNSCSSAVQADFEQGVLLLHSFEFEQAEDDFRRVESADPRCVIAAWGLALAETGRSGANAPKENLAKGWSGLQPWIGRPAGSRREQLYFNAVRAMYEGFPQTAGTVRWSRYLHAMDRLRTLYPDDVNARLFYALGLVWTAGSGPDGLVKRRRALSILLPIFKAQPDNPGAAHYIIHAADTPELATIALPAARRYASIAPDSPHALHMPSHIFNRLGDWPDSIAANLASSRVALQWIKSGRGGLFDEQHALNNLEYAYLQLGKTAEAREIIARIDRVDNAPDGDPWGPIDARLYFDLETRDWGDALTLQPPSGSPFEANYDIFWIDAIANARLGRPAAAQASLDQFRKSSAAWIQTHNVGDVLHLALVEADAWTLFAQGRKQEAVDELSRAADFEKNHALYYADVLPRPSAQMLGDMLLQMGESEKACAAFQDSLHIAPNTLDSVQGLRTCTHQSARAFPVLL
jgi:tetratricopeptide (TPR) repeat protein